MAPSPPSYAYVRYVTGSARTLHVRMQILTYFWDLKVAKLLHDTV